MAAPAAIKAYMQYLIGQSLKKDIFHDILTFGLIYLFLVFFRGIVFGLYLSLASKSLFAKICSKITKMNV